MVLLVAIGVAVYYGMQGEKLTDGPVDLWLDRCWWGKHQRLKLPTLKVKDGSAVSMVFRYFPDEVDLPDQMIEFAKTFKDD